MRRPVFAVRIVLPVMVLPSTVTACNKPAMIVPRLADRAESVAKFVAVCSGPTLPAGGT